MTDEVIGSVQSGSNHRIEVSWNSDSGEVYVKGQGADWTRAGDASSASQAMRIAEAFVYNW
jgi:hypothetical protein